MLGLATESQFSPLAPWMKLAGLVSGAVYQVTGDEALAGQFDIRARLEVLGKSLSAGAFADGRQGAKVADVVIEAAIDQAQGRRPYPSALPN